jgi:hypothetical protein
MLDKLGNPGPLEISATENATVGGASHMMACMIAGLKNWQQGMLDHAAKCFTAASSVQLTGNDSWAAIYQRLAADYLADYQTLSGPLFADFPHDKRGCDDAVAKLDVLINTLKTQGRARFNVRAWQLDLARKGILLKAAGSAPGLTDSSSAGVPPTLADVMEKLDVFSKECNFPGAAAYLKTLTEDPPGASRISLLSLVESASVFIDDLEQDIKKEPAVADLQLKSGELISKLYINPSGKLSVVPKTGDPHPCTWGDFTADSLIGLHRMFVRASKSDSDSVRRNECAISYGWLTGNRELALAAAGKLSQSSPDFKHRWEAILKGLPK